MSTSSIQRVHLVFKTHLDVGFTDLAEVVKQRYYRVYYPLALQTARALRARGGPERFTWTTGSWILYEYLEQASSQERAEMEQAILDGTIAWHALPFTIHSELLDASLFRYGLSISQKLDQRFNKQTIAGKMTDVPGHTRAIVPLLAEAGIRFLHIGVNPASTTPEVPPLFVWRDPQSSSEVVVMYQPGSYGDLTLVPGSPVALAFAHTLDNLGPQTSEQALTAFAHVRSQVPGAVVAASTLDAFAREILPLKGQLPVITAELGDSWIHGTGSDPLKVSQYRALSRLRRQWLSTGQLTETDMHYRLFSDNLLQVAEHTWGLDEKTHLDDYSHYSPAQLQPMLTRPNFRFFASSWAEQRAYVHNAVAALGDSAEAREAQAALEQLQPHALVLDGYQRLTNSTARYESDYFSLAFNEQGALAWLQEKQSGRLWADHEHPLALFFYELFSQSEYDRFFKQYIINPVETAAWARKDFTKEGIEQVVSAYQRWQPTLTEVWQRQGDTGTTFYLRLHMPEESWRTYGAPRLLELEIKLPRSAPVLEITLQWFEKQASRLPEALWLSFQPIQTTRGSWSLHKMGQWISPLEVISNGNRTLHAVERGVRYAEDETELLLETLDAPLVAPGQPSLLNFHNQQPSMDNGVHFNLFNNIWGTNFPMWYGEDTRLRFVLRF